MSLAPMSLKRRSAFARQQHALCKPASTIEKVYERELNHSEPPEYHNEDIFAT
jgi:hypothetical protein